MRRVPILGGVLLLTALACESPPRHVKLDLPREEVGEVRGCSITGGLFAPEHYVTFLAVDGQELDELFPDGNPQVLDLLPGKHTLVCEWVSIDKPEFDEDSGTELIHLDVKAGAVYQAHLYWENLEPRVRFQEILPPRKDAP